MTKENELTKERSRSATRNPLTGELAFLFRPGVPGQDYAALMREAGGAIVTLEQAVTHGGTVTIEHGGVVFMGVQVLGRDYIFPAPGSDDGVVLRFHLCGGIVTTKRIDAEEAA